MPETASQASSSSNNPVPTTFTESRKIGTDQLRNPTGVCLRNNGQEIVVCNTYKHCVSVFDRVGDLVLTIGGRSLLKGLLNYPSRVAITLSNKCIVVDRDMQGDNAIKIFDESSK